MSDDKVYKAVDDDQPATQSETAQQAEAAAAAKEAMAEGETPQASEAPKGNRKANTAKAAQSRAKAADKVSQSAKQAKDEGTVTIVLFDNDDFPPGGVSVGHNGQFKKLKPGVEYTLPKRFLNVLNDAVKSVPKRDPKTGQIIGQRQVMRFPYQVVDKK